MTGPDHYAQGEVELERASRTARDNGGMYFVALAQAHFTAALAAATALAAITGAETHGRWLDAINGEAK